MVNSTAQNFINFQSQVGKAQSKTKLWGAYIVSFVLIFIGLNLKTGAERNPFIRLY